MTTSNHAGPGKGDFDFLIGTWDIVNRRLLAPLSGSAEWDQFPSTAECHGTLFDGAANLDEITFHTKGFSGLTLRLFEPEREEWTLSWVSSRDGRLALPMTGRFGTDGVGEFYGEDTHEGTAILCRFIWSGITSSAARWEQAFSTDDGQTWETNWIMEHSRTRAELQER